MVLLLIIAAFDLVSDRVCPDYNRLQIEFVTKSGSIVVDRHGTQYMCHTGIAVVFQTWCSAWHSVLLPHTQTPQHNLPVHTPAQSACMHHSTICLYRISAQSVSSPERARVHTSPISENLVLTLTLELAPNTEHSGPPMLDLTWMKKTLPYSA